MEVGFAVTNVVIRNVETMSVLKVQLEFPGV